MLLRARSIAPKQEDSSMEAWRNRPGRASVSTGRGRRTCRRATSAPLGSLTGLAGGGIVVHERARHVGPAAGGAKGPSVAEVARRHVLHPRPVDTDARPGRLRQASIELSSCLGAMLRARSNIF